MPNLPEMLDHKIFKLLQVLTPKELLEVEKHLAVPIINPTEDVLRLFSLACKFYPRFDDTKLKKEWLHKQLFGKQPYNDGRMRKLMTQLTQAIERFLVQKELWKSQELQAKLLARSLGERDNYELFLDVMESRLKALDKGVERGRDYFRESFELCELVYFHPESEKLSKRDKYLIRAIIDFEQFFTLVSLQNEANNIVRSRLLRGQGFSHYLETVKQMAHKPEFASSSAISLFHYIVNLLQGQSDENLAHLRHTAFETFDLLSRFEQDFAINLLRSYAVPMANNGSLPHKRFIMDLFKLELERGFFADTISAGAFMNIVSMGLGVDELDWVEHFIVSFNDYLPLDEREVTLNYCKGLLCYQKGLKTNQLEYFYSAIQYLNLIPIRIGAKFDIRVRPYMLRIHFEILERRKETLDDLLMNAKNFERHLTGSGIYAEPVQESHLNFLRYFKSLARMASMPELNKNAVHRFIDRLNQDESSIAQKPWMLEKAKGLVKVS